MTEREQLALLAICLHAAFADGAKDEREREQIRRVADGLAPEAQRELLALYQDVLLKRRSVADSAAALSSPEQRQLAYEMAVCVCDADGARNDAERAFLAELAVTLGLDPAGSRRLAEEADAIAVAAEVVEPVPEPEPAPPLPAGSGRPVDEAALDRRILSSAVLAGALELLPQSLASMAVIPLQMRLVFTIGQAYGFTLDRGQVKDLLATLGIGLTSQYLENIGRKLLGGLFKRAGGGLFGALGRQATSSGMAFATTYALGHVAKRYYAGGRRIDATQLRAVFEDLLRDAGRIQSQYAGEIASRARTLDPAQLLTAIRRGVP